MAMAVTIDARFNGPTGSANGGYACGVAARALTDGPAEVVLRRPPPLGVAMDVVETGDGIELHDDGQVVAIARAWTGAVEVPPAPEGSAVERAEVAFDLAAYTAAHPFERCFTCGPAREPGDGLRLFPTPLDSRTVVSRWAPDGSMTAADGLVDPIILWAALDCPSGLCWISPPEGESSGPAVLGRFAVGIDRRPAVGEDLVVAGWQVAAEGRKRLAGSAIWGQGGEVLASAAATWVVLDAEQAAAFGANG